jgi:hypothetical protein
MGKASTGEWDGLPEPCTGAPPGCDRSDRDPPKKVKPREGTQDEFDSFTLRKGWVLEQEDPTAVPLALLGDKVARGHR